MAKNLKQLQSFVVGVATYIPAHGASRAMRAGIYLLRLVFRILKQWARDRCPQQAAALAFQTALSLVPIFAVGFSILPKEQQDQLYQFVSRELLPGMDAVTNYLQQFMANISIGALGGGGLIFTLVTCYSLFASLEKVFNDIWRVRERRSLVSKFLTFYAMLTLIPAMAGYSLYQSGRMFTTGAPGWVRVLAPLAIQFVALAVMNKLLPRTFVRWWAACAGAVVSGICLEATKWGFVTYVKAIMLQNYAGIYGSLGLLPLLLMWVYTAWLIVLLGTEIAHAAQNLRMLEAEERRRRDQEPINALVAAQLLATVAAAHGQGRAITKERLATTYSLTPDVIERIFERLKARGLAATVSGDLNGYIPARPANTITMEDVLAAFRSTDLETAQGATSVALQTLVNDLDASRKARIAGVTIADLVPPPEAVTEPD